MPKDYSPFTPGQPVPLEFFVGRLAQVERLERKVAAAVQGRVQLAFVSGERGIGKSSLASFVRFIAERDDQILGLHTFLGGVTSLEEMVRRVFERLLKESVDGHWFEKIRDFFGKHIRQVGLFDVSVEFRAPGEELQQLVRNFAPSLRGLMNRIQDETRGLLIILDDINGLATSEEFANWIKSLVDEIATSGESFPACITLVGLEQRRQSLLALNPSLARYFDLIDIPQWETKETRDFFTNAFGKADVAIETKALDLLVGYTGGLPVLGHEIGDAVFQADKDNVIDEQDASNGIVAAADIVGRKHLEPQVLNAIRSPRYRAILRTLDRQPDIEFSRGELLAFLNNDEAKVLDNFLTRMKGLGIIQPNPEALRGGYQFTNLLHSLYFSLEAKRAKEETDGL